MAGHSQFKNIMFRKGKQDKERSKLFAKLSREITVAAKSGLTDPAHNPRLRTAIIAAKAESMPKDNIERAINKAAGNTGENYDEVRYEGRGPGGVALIIETMTDNRNRTSADVRAAFSKYGGQMGETGSVSFMFDHVGVITYPPEKGSEDAMLEAALEPGTDGKEIKFTREVGDFAKTEIVAKREQGDSTAKVVRIKAGSSEPVKDAEGNV